MRDNMKYWHIVQDIMEDKDPKACSDESCTLERVCEYHSGVEHGLLTMYLRITNRP